MDKSINVSNRSKRLVEKARQMLALQETCNLPIENSVDLDLAILPVCIALENGNFQEISDTSQAATTSRSDISEGIITLTNHTSHLATLDADILNSIDFNHSNENGIDINLNTGLHDSEIENSSNNRFEHNYAICGHNENRDNTLLSLFCVDDNYVELSSPNLLGENGNDVEAQFVTDIAFTNYLNPEDKMEQQCTSNNISSNDAENSVMEETEENMNKECDKEQHCSSNNVSSNDVEEMVVDETEERMNKKCDQDANGDLHNVENRLSRKPWSWNRNIQQSKRQKGRAYKGLKKNPVSGIYEYSQQKEPKKMKPPCECKMSAGNTKLKCRMVVEVERKNIFKYFWRKLDWNEKKMYVVGLVDVMVAKDKKNKKNEVSRRTFTYNFNLKVHDIRIRVCRTMFLNTLGLGRWSMLSWIQKNNNMPTNQTNSDTDSDDNVEVDETTLEPTKSKRSRHVSDLKLVEQRNHLEEFLKALPKMESHYCRQNTGKLYFETLWNSKSELFKHYEEVCKLEMKQPLSYKPFSEIMVKLRYDVYLPKKDQCDLCCSYKNGNITEDTYKNHIKNKEDAREAKKKDTNSSSDGVHVFTMDLEKVLLAPSLKVSALYYKLKLCVHNFTFYNNKTKVGFCYIWHEAEGGITSNEFASIICDFISKKTSIKSGETVILYSDGCTYQNRNATLANALLHLSQLLKITIIQKYLEKGHTQMECDSMHSCIERKLLKSDIYTPAQYIDICKCARGNPEPYKVYYLDHKFFQDYSGINYTSSIRPGHGVGDPTVTDIRGLKYSHDGLYYKIKYNDDWKPIPRRLRKSMDKLVQSVKPLFLQPRKIKKQKYDHLQQLKSFIPNDYHSFYDNLIHD